jgi:hypothetical protein
MAAAELAVGGLLVLAMIGVSVRGWRTLPPDARIPVRRGLRGYGGYRSKTYGLLAWPAAGVVIYGLFFVVFAEGLATRYARGGEILVPFLAALFVLIAGQIRAIRAAGRTSGEREIGTGLR